jgi:hypothetical protein
VLKLPVGNIQLIKPDWIPQHMVKQLQSMGGMRGADKGTLTADKDVVCVVYVESACDVPLVNIMCDRSLLGNCDGVIYVQCGAADMEICVQSYTLHVRVCVCVC